MFSFALSIVRGRFNASFALCPGFLTFFAVSVLAQHPVQPADTADLEKIQAQAQSRREMELRNLGAQAEMSNNPRRVQEVASEIEQDFQKILVLHNGLARFLLDRKPLDYGFVSDASAEIRKRAVRLQKTLALSLPAEELTKERNAEFEDAQIRDGVATLCNQIKSFVTNPVIENPGTISAEQLTKARHDLQTVIDLSSSLKKSADRLKKASTSP